MAPAIEGVQSARPSNSVWHSAAQRLGLVRQAVKGDGVTSPWQWP